MLTQRVPSWTRRWLTPAPISEEAEDAIARYSPRGGRDRVRYDELALVVVHTMLLVSLILLSVVVGLIASGLRDDGVQHVISDVAVFGIAWCLVGIAFHLIRYYAIYFSRSRPKSSGGASTWPVVSSDLDFAAQVAIALVVLSVSGWS
jgi:hypothetical protein